MSLEGACESITEEQLLVANIVEGCIGETLAADQARRQAQGARADLANDLNDLADDEERHAVLAWKILTWQLSTGGESLRQLALDTFRKNAPRPRQVSETLDDPDIGAETGFLSFEERTECDQLTWREAVVPIVLYALGHGRRAENAQGEEAII